MQIITSLLLCVVFLFVKELRQFQANSDSDKNKTLIMAKILMLQSDKVFNAGKEIETMK
jgi:hypothetical protein